jgi:hypothetical protein
MSKIKTKNETSVHSNQGTIQQVTLNVTFNINYSPDANNSCCKNVELFNGDLVLLEALRVISGQIKDHLSYKTE